LCSCGGPLGREGQEQLAVRVQQFACPVFRGFQKDCGGWANLPLHRDGERHKLCAECLRCLSVLVCVCVCVGGGGGGGGGGGQKRQSLLCLLCVSLLSLLFSLFSLLPTFFRFALFSSLFPLLPPLPLRSPLSPLFLCSTRRGRRDRSALTQQQELTVRGGSRGVCCACVCVCVCVWRGGEALRATVYRQCVCVDLSLSLSLSLCMCVCVCVGGGAMDRTCVCVCGGGGGEEALTPASVSLLSSLFSCSLFFRLPHFFLFAFCPLVSSLSSACSLFPLLLCLLSLLSDVFLFSLSLFYLFSLFSLLSLVSFFSLRSVLPFLSSLIQSRRMKHRTHVCLFCISQRSLLADC
jgi:hypothetical protein